MLAYIGNSKLINTDMIGSVRLLPNKSGSCEVVLETKAKEEFVIFNGNKSEAENKFNEILVELKQVDCLINFIG